MDDNLGGANYQESHRMVFGNTSYIEEGDSLITKNRLLNFYDQYIAP